MPTLNQIQPMTPVQARILLCQVTAIRWGEHPARDIYVTALLRAQTDHVRRRVRQAGNVLGLSTAARL